MKQSYTDSKDFVEDLHKESVKSTLALLGYIDEEDFKGSKISCPFHGEDKTPSMQVTDNFFKCYGCGAKGDLIKWVELSDGLNFVEAIKHIAEGLQVSLESANFTEYTRMKLLIDKEWEGYKTDLNGMLAVGNHFSSYLKSEIRKYFPQEVGLDKKTGYLVLPFTSKTGTVLGFTKRRLDYKGVRDGAKWIHSSTHNSLIKYCSNIFNLGRAHKHINASKSVDLVEGPKDVAAMERAGFLSTVAVCGTSNVSVNVLTALGAIEELCLIMDGDAAGKKAIVAAIISISKHNINLVSGATLVIMPEGEDPASLTQDELINLRQNPIDALPWFVSNASDDEIVSLVTTSASAIIRSDVVRLLNKRFGYTSPESNEWIDSRIGKKPADEQVIANDMKTRLLATIGEISNPDVQPFNMSDDEARKILKLRYNYK